MKTFSLHDQDEEITLLAAPCNLGGAAPEPLRPETSGAGLEGHGGVAPKPPIPLALPKGIERLVFFIGRGAWRAEKGKKREGLRPIIPEARNAPPKISIYFLT